MLYRDQSSVTRRFDQQQTKGKSKQDEARVYLEDLGSALLLNALQGAHTYVNVFFIRNDMDLNELTKFDVFRESDSRT